MEARMRYRILEPRNLILPFPIRKRRTNARRGFRRYRHRGCDIESLYWARGPTRHRATFRRRRARAAVNRPADLTDEMVAKKIIELAKAGERNVEGLCEAALNVPAGAVSAPNPPPLPASPPSKPDSSF